MADVFDATILCEKCNEKAKKGEIRKEGFPIRVWQCHSCNQIWHHPSDMQDFENFRKIKDKRFKVKLRLVGNSYTVSIPREIIAFEEMMQQDIDDMIQLGLESPGKVNLFFSRRIGKLL